MRDREDERARSRSRSREREFARKDYRGNSRNEARVFKIFIDFVPLGTKVSEVGDAFERFGKVKDLRLFEKRNPDDFEGPPIGNQGHVVLDAETEVRNNVPAFLRDRHPEWVVSAIREITAGDDRGRYEKFGHNFRGDNGRHGGPSGGNNFHKAGGNFSQSGGGGGGYGGNFGGGHGPRSHHQQPFHHQQQHGMMGNRHRDEGERDNFHSRRDDKGFDRMGNGPRGDFERGGPMMHMNLNRMDSDPNNIKMNDPMMPINMQGGNMQGNMPGNIQPNIQSNIQANMQANLQGTMIGGKSDPSAANPFEKFGLNFQQMLQLPPERFAEITRNLNSQSKEGPFTGSIQVREIWIGNLPPNITEEHVRQAAEMFGEVENVDLHNKPNNVFAFVRYNRVINATKACENSHQFRKNIGYDAIKVSFSDHLRRKNIIGDSYDCEKDEELTPTLYIGFSTGCNIAPEPVIRECLSEYGDVIFVSIKQSSIDNSARSYLLAEMATLEQAKNVRRKMFIMDKRREKRIRLGDKNAEISILIRGKRKDEAGFAGNGPNKQFNTMDNKMLSTTPIKRQSSYEGGHQSGGMNNNNRFMPQNQMNMNPNGNNNQQQFYGQNGPHQGGFNQNFQRGGMPIMQQSPNQNFINQQDLNKQQQPLQQGPNMQQAQPRVMQPGQQMQPQLLQPQQQMNPQQIQQQPMQNLQQPQQQQRGNFPFYGSPQQNFPTNGNFGMMNNNLNNNLQGPGGNVTNPPFIDNGMPNQALQQQHQQYPNPNVLNGQPGLENGPRQDSSMNMEIDTSKISEIAQLIDKIDQEELGDTFWSGFITRSKKHRVGVDAYFIKGDELTLNDFNLNVNYRSEYHEVLTKEHKAVVVFSPSNETQKAIFEDYIQYFRSKDRAGVVPLKKMHLYLLPACEQAFRIHKFNENQILGVFVDENAKTVKPPTPTAIEDVEDGDEGDVKEVLDLFGDPEIAKNLSQLLG